MYLCKVESMNISYVAIKWRHLSSLHKYHTSFPAADIFITDFPSYRLSRQLSCSIRLLTLKQPIK